MSQVYLKYRDLSEAELQAVQISLIKLLKNENSQSQSKLIQQELRSLTKQLKKTVTQDLLIQVFIKHQATGGLPEATSRHLAKIRLKPIRSLSGVQIITVLTKPFPCPGKCIFCPNDIRMPKSYIASEPGAQRAERNSFDPYLQTYNRLLALTKIGHLPTKIELIVLGGTWSFYPEEYQIWFIKECFRALNDFSSKKDDRQNIQDQIAKSVASNHRLNNRVVNFENIEVDGQNIKKSYNQIVSQYYLLPEKLTQLKSARKETASWSELNSEQKINEASNIRCVGLTLETRPDAIDEQEVIKTRRFGATKTQIGLQSLSDKVLDLNKRGHNTDASKKAIKLLRQAGFKIHVHWMPNLYGSDPDNDQREFLQLFSDKAYQPDELKIYPCTLIPSAELMQYFQAEKWQPYSPKELSSLLYFCLTKAPEWVRITRVIRDIPTSEMAFDQLKTNLRQQVENSIKSDKVVMRDIRAREIKNDLPHPPIKLNNIKYPSESGTNYFLQFVDKNHRILGFLRLYLPSQPSFIPELSQNAIIRELHVYGQVEPFGQQGTGSTQHRGLGKKLLVAAEKIAAEQGYAEISVISAIGTKGYYRKQGYTDGQLYQHKKLIT